MRPAEHRILGQDDRAQLHERVDQLVDRRLAELGKRRMRRAPRGAQLQPQDAARREPQPIVGRLAVDEIAALLLGRRSVGDARAVAAPLLADDEDEGDARFPVAPQTSGRRDLGGQDALGVACAAAVEAIAVDAAREERRHAVDVRREGDRLARAVRRAGGRRDDVEAHRVDALLEERPAVRAQVVGERPRRCALAARGGIDVDERPRQRDDVGGIGGGRCHAVTGSTIRARCAYRCASLDTSR